MNNTYSVSLTHLGNISGYYNDGNSVYGAEFNEIPALTPYYERVVHYTDQKPWIGQNMDKTYMNYSKMMNEDPVLTYKQLEFTAPPEDNHEIIENFENFENSKNIENFESRTCGNCAPKKTVLNENNSFYTNNTPSNIDNFDKDLNNTNRMQNSYGKMLFILFLFLSIYLIINY